MSFLLPIAMLVEYPLLALGPAALFIYLFWISKSRFILLTAILWLAYLPYEYAMKYRILCSGECDIRIDLLLIYPVLVFVSLLSLVAFIINMRRRA